MKKVKTFIFGAVLALCLSIPFSSCGGDGNSSSNSKNTVCTSCDGKGFIDGYEGGCPSSCLNRQAALPCTRHVAKAVRNQCKECNGKGHL